MSRPASILVAVALALPALPFLGQSSPDPAALHALLEGRLNDAIPALTHDLQQTPSPANELLLCRALLSENHLDDALTHCQAAADSPSAPSDAYLWLGRVQGGRASRANPLAAFGIARKVKAAFARSVELDPHNTDAVDDLGEFLIEAPAVVGGGKDDARDLATRSATATPSASHRILARLAESSDDLPSAEREYRAAADASPASKRAGALVDLAHFYARHNRAADATATLRTAVAADQPASSASVDAAGLLTTLKASPAQATALLRAYLASPARSDAAPAWRAHLQLSRLLAQQGDTAGAAREQDAAHRLAPDAIPPDPPKDKPDSKSGASAQVP